MKTPAPLADSNTYPHRKCLKSNTVNIVKSDLLVWFDFIYHIPETKAGL